MKVTSDKVSDLLVNRLQKMIKTQQLQAGMRLPSERTLATELQVSRASVREALQKLNSRGLLSTRPGGGSYLCKPLAPWADQRLHDPVKAAMVDDPSYQSDILEARQTLKRGLHGMPHSGPPRKISSVYSIATMHCANFSLTVMQV